LWYCVCFSPEKPRQAWFANPFDPSSFARKVKIFSESQTCSLPCRTSCHSSPKIRSGFVQRARFAYWHSQSNEMLQHHATLAFQDDHPVLFPVRLKRLNQFHIVPSCVSSLNRAKWLHAPSVWIFARLLADRVDSQCEFVWCTVLINVEFQTRTSTLGQQNSADSICGNFPGSRRNPSQLGKVIGWKILEA
jgi:hypothetical protein